MEVSMSRRLVFGAVSRQRLVGLSPIGIVNGREVFPIAGAEDDDDPATPGDEPDENDDDDDDDDSDDDKDDKPAARSKRSVRNSRTSEFNRMKRERNALLREKQEREKAAREAALKEKPEIERAKAERDDATKERDELRERLSSASVELEIIKSSRNKYDWADIEDVLNDRTVRKAIEIGEDGEITGVSEALKDLAKRKPHFLVKPSEEDDKNGKNDNGRKTAAAGAGNSNGKSGGNPGSGNGDNLAVDRERLNAAYPALARLPQ